MNREVQAMSDFDTVLERLVTDPPFAAALAADPASALAGYRLDADETALLCSQVGADCGGQSAVEQRTTKSSTFGLIGSMLSFAESVPGLMPGGDAAPRATSGLGQAPGGSHQGGWGASVPVADAQTGLGGPSATSGLGDAPAARSGLGERGTVYGSTARISAQEQEIAPPKGYRNSVDADGDGTWDEATYRGRADGGVDILVDLDGDGRTDFVGHDVDADRTVDSADYDKDGDGFFEKRMHDDDGDGLLDRTVRRRRG
jgi:hypothetical protein